MERAGGGYVLWDALAMPRIYVSATDPGIRFEPGLPSGSSRRSPVRGFVLLPHEPDDNHFGDVQVILVRADGTPVRAAPPRRDGAVVG
jgi:hypothetical protein